MCKEFEKYFPLPLRAIDEDIVSSSDISLVSLLSPDLEDEQCAEIAKYLATCANLMPEAVEALNSCKAHFEEYCEHCEDTTREECPWCSKGQILEQVKSVLAKLEGGGVNVPDTSGS